MTLKLNTPVSLIVNEALQRDDLTILTLLYQPVIGFEAMSLYLTLVAYKEMGIPLTHQQLIGTQGISLQQFIEYRHKLEAVNLIQTYELSNVSLTYLILPPLKAPRFFKDGVMNAFLSLQVGDEDYRMLRHHFLEKQMPKEGHNISKTFNEVFNTTIVNSRAFQETQPLDDAYLVAETSGPILDLSFDASILASALKRVGVDYARLSHQTIEQLNQLSFLYKLNEDDLSRLVFDALDVDGFINLQEMKKLAKHHFQLLRKGGDVKVTQVAKTKEPSAQVPPQSQDTAQTRDENLKYYLAHTHPLDYLKQRSHNKTPVPSECDLVEWLLVDQQMVPGVINVLLHYVLRISNDRLPKALVEKVAAEWQRKNVTTLEAAMKQVEVSLKGTEKTTAMTVKNKKAPYQKQKVLRQEPMPDWALNYDANSKPQKSEARTYTEEELEKIKKMKQLQEKLFVRKG